MYKQLTGNRRAFSLLFALSILLVAGCDANGADGQTDPSSVFVKRVEVFGILVQATAGVPDEKALHAASVMAQYLDNDEDGTPDNQQVVDALVSRRATLVMFRDENELESLMNQLENTTPIDAAQDLQANETVPGGATQGVFDATLEEVLHLITHVGFANVYPDAFGESIGSELANAMDVARGGRFETIPSRYPAEAWYTYDDQTCDYSCQVTEYVYWALTSMLGAQDFPGRLDEINNEWRLNTREKVEATDKAVFALLTHPAYKLPTVLPDSEYRGGILELQK